MSHAETTRVSIRARGRGAGRANLVVAMAPRSASTFLESSAGRQLSFLHDHAMVSEIAFGAVVEGCAPLGAAGGARTTCLEEVSDPSPQVIEQCYQRSEGVYLCPLTNSSAPAFQCCAAMNAAMDNIGTVNIYGIYEQCPQPRDPSMIPSVRPTLPMWPEGSERLLRGLDGCWGSTEHMTNYLNRPDVRAALHVKSLQEFSAMYAATEGNDTLWRGCGMHNVQYDRGGSRNLLPLYARLAERPELRMLIFNGDVDACANHMVPPTWLHLGFSSHVVVLLAPADASHTTVRRSGCGKLRASVAGAATRCGRRGRSTLRSLDTSHNLKTLASPSRLYTELVIWYLSDSLTL